MYDSARMHSRATCDSSTAQTAFYVSKVKRLHAYFFGSINKSGIVPTFLYFGAVCIRFLVHPGAQLSAVCLIIAYRTQARQKGICLYPLSITGLDYWAYIVFML